MVIPYPALVVHCDWGSAPDEINPFRPFYPQKPGSSRRAYLVSSPGLESFDQLKRLCEITELANLFGFANEGKPVYTPKRQHSSS